MLNCSIWNTRGTNSTPISEGVAVTGTTTYYSDVWLANNGTGYSLSQFWTGTPTGTFTLWYTDKRNPSLADDTDWVQDSTFSPTNPAGSASKMGDQAGTFSALKKRLKYVNASGSGTLKGYVTGPRHA